MSNLKDAVPPLHKGGADVWACPSCGSGKFVYSAGFKPNRFCGNCGQKIDWSYVAADIDGLCKPPYNDVVSIIYDRFGVDQNAVIMFLKTAKPVQVKIVTMHTRHDMSFATIAKYYNVTQQRISNVFQNSIRAIKKIHNAESGSIDKLNLSYRAIRILTDVGITDANEIARMSIDELSSICGIGDNTAKEIFNRVRALNKEDKSYGNA